MAVVGHSTGGLVAYALAASHPELVTSSVVEDMGAVTGPPHLPTPVLDVSDWPARAPDRERLRAETLAHGLPDAEYFLDSAVQDGTERRLLFDLEDMMESQYALVGYFCAQWLGSTCPAPPLRGAHSGTPSPTMARRMVGRRPDTTLVEFPGAATGSMTTTPRRTAG